MLGFKLGPAPAGQAVTDMTESFLILSGQTRIVNVYIDGPGGGSGWQSMTAGTSVEVKLHSADGMDYLRLIALV